MKHPRKFKKALKVGDFKFQKLDIRNFSEVLQPSSLQSSSLLTMSVHGYRLVHE